MVNEKMHGHGYVDLLKVPHKMRTSRTDFMQIIYQYFVGSKQTGTRIRRHA